MRTHSALVALVAYLAIAGTARARPTHGPIEPLAAGVELDSSAYFPLDVGRTWTYHDVVGIRYRRVIAGSVSLIDTTGKRHDWLRRREIYELPPAAPPKLIDRWLFELNPDRGIVSIGGENPEWLTGAVALPGGEIEMPRKLTAGAWWIAYQIEYRFQGVADIDVEAGSFKGCAVIDAKGEHKLPSGERADTRTFYCPNVGAVAALVMVQGAWRPALELEKWYVMKPTEPPQKAPKQRKP